MLTKTHNIVRAARWHSNGLPALCRHLSRLLCCAGEEREIGNIPRGFLAVSVFGGFWEEDSFLICCCGSSLDRCLAIRFEEGDGLPAVKVLLGEAELAALLPRLDGAPLAHLGRQLVVHHALEAPRGVALEGGRAFAFRPSFKRKHQKGFRFEVRVEGENVARL